MVLSPVAIKEMDEPPKNTTDTVVVIPESSPNIEDIGVSFMLQFQSGDREAFTSLFDAYYPAIFRFCYRILLNSHDAEEITQDTFMQVCKASSTYKPLAKFSTWVYTIAKNLCINKLKSQKHNHFMQSHTEDGISTLETLVSQVPTPDTEIERKETAEVVKQAIQSLSPLLRTALILSRYENLSIKEIAIIMECSEVAVKVRVHRAMLGLEKRLQYMKN
jgi:RNA polymerase sigma-70 factor (ECF subfamily)